MKREAKTVKMLVVVWMFGLVLFALSMSVMAQSPDDAPAPTLVPPTLLPAGEQVVTPLPAESGVARIMRDGRVRVGVLFNMSPFGSMNIQGEISGFDADLARAIAETWGVTAELVQVTRQNGMTMVNSGQIDLLIAAQVHRRELDTQVEFSHTYYVGSQALMVRRDDAAQALSDMNGRRIGVVIGTPSESAVTAWQARTAINLTVQPYYTLDRAGTALVSGEVDGIVARRVDLPRAVPLLETVRVLDEAVQTEPMAIALRRQDIHLRNLVNQTLQFLVVNERIPQIHAANFQESSYFFEGTEQGPIPIWANLPTDAPTPSRFGTDLSMPAASVQSQLASSGVVRVAGFGTLPDDASEGQRRLDTLYRALIEAMAARWGVRVEYVPDSASTPMDFVVNGQADLAIGVTPDWAWADRLDFTQAFMQRGYRLLVPSNETLNGFGEMTGNPYIAYLISDPNAAEVLRQVAESVNRPVRTYGALPGQLVYSMLESDNADFAFGDSLDLLPELEANGDLVRLTLTDSGRPRWYGLRSVAFAVPRNDSDFRLLVEYTLQDLYIDGTLDRLLQPVSIPNEPRLPLEVWSGLGG